MNKTHRSLIAAVALAAGGASWADGPLAPAAIATNVVTEVGAAPIARAVPPSTAALRATFQASTGINARRLGETRGGSATSDTVGSVRDASATNVAGAPNTIRDGSFTGAAGLVTVIQNSGSNVLIQNSTTVNVQFRP